MISGWLPPDFTLRSVLGGLFVGTLLCCTNLYLGLQSAFITMASMQAALVGFGLIRLYTSTAGRASRIRHARSRTLSSLSDDEHDEDPRHGRRTTTYGSEWRPRWATGSKPFTAQENAVLQATAVSLGAMPLCAGLIGIVPAFNLLSPDKDGKDVQPFTLSWSALVVWCASMAFFGIFLASPMRTPMIIRERLRFPSGSATAQLICILHRKKIRTDDDDGKAAQRQSVGRRDHADERRPLLRRSLSEREQEEEVSSGWTALAVTFAASTAITIASFAVPVLYAIPAFDILLPCHDAASKWGWYVTPSLSYVGQGIIMGPQTTTALFAGAVVGWAVISPTTNYLGWTNGIPTDAESGSQAWLIWVSLAIMTSESIVGLGVLTLSQNPRFAAWIRRDDRSTSSEEQQTSSSRAVPSAVDHEPASRRTPRSWIAFGLLASTVASTALHIALFQQPDAHKPSATLHDFRPWVPVVGIILAAGLSVMAVRSLGATDLNPVSALGKLSQLAFAFLLPGNIVVNMVGGALSEAGAQQAGELMQDFKTGHLVGASPRGQFLGQLVGSTAGVFVSATAYKLYERAYKLPGPELPAPAARIWLNFARLINRGSLPPYSGTAMIVAASLFAVTTLCKGIAGLLPSEDNDSTASWRSRLQRWSKYLPNGIAFAVGLGLNSPNYSLARLLGGLVVVVFQRRREAARRSAGRSPSSSSSSNGMPPVTLLIWSAGFVLGEGFASIVLLLFKQFGLGPLTCWGCRGGCGGGC